MAARYGFSSSAKELAYQLKYGTLTDAQSALETLVNQYGQALQSYFARRLPNWAVKSDEHKDLEQKVWAILWEEVRSCKYDPARGTIVAYTWGIAWKLILQWWQGLPARPPIPPSEPPQPVLGHRLDAAYCLARLAEKDVDAFIVLYMIYFEGKSEREAAIELGVAPSTVHDRKKRGLKFLRQCLSGYGI